MSTTVTVGQILLFLAFLFIMAVSTAIWYRAMRSLDYVMRGDDGQWNVVAVIGHTAWAAVFIGYAYFMFWALVQTS